MAVETASRGVLVAPRLLTYLGAQSVVEASPVLNVAPLSEIPVYTRPLWILMGEHAPFDAPVDDIEDGIDHHPPIELAVAPTWLGWRDQIFESNLG